MQDYKSFLHHSSVPTSAQSHGEFLSLAALRYAISIAVANVDDAEALRALLALAKQGAREDSKQY